MVLSQNKLSNKLLHILAYGRNNLQSSSVSFAPVRGPQKGRGIYANRCNKVNIVQPTISTSQLTLSEYLKENIENISSLQVSLEKQDLNNSSQTASLPILTTNIEKAVVENSSYSMEARKRSGYAEKLDSKINNLKSNNLESTSSSFSSSNSVEGFKNFLSNNKIKTIQEDFDLYKNLIENIQFKAGVPNNDSNSNKYKKLLATQITELCQMSQFLGLNNVTTLSNKENKIVEANSNLSCIQDPNTAILAHQGEVGKRYRQYLNSLTNFNFKLSNSYYDYFHFNKSNNNKYLFAMEKATNLLKLVFLSKGCLISKPIFNVVYNSSNIAEEIKNNNMPYTGAVQCPTLGKGKDSDKPKIIINLFYFVSFSTKKVEKITNIYNDKFLFLSEYLNKLFNCDVELNLVRLYLPYQDSNILAQYLNIGSFKKRFVYLASRLFRTVKIFKKNSGANRGIKTTLPNGKILPSCILNGPFAPIISPPTVPLPFRKDNDNDIKEGVAGVNTSTENGFVPNGTVSYPSGVSGINIKLAGRTPTQKLIPRVAVRRAQRGNFSRLNSKMIEKSMCVDTSKKGSFNFTVRLSHVFR